MYVDQKMRLQSLTTVTDELLEKSALKIAIVASRANNLVVSRLIDGALRALLAANIGMSQIYLLEVMGALEIPLALQKVALTRKFTTFVVLGAVIKGSTDHYDHVSRMAHDGVMKVALTHNLSLGNGILTVHSLELALERADGPCGNLGFDAARAALSLSGLFTSLDKEIRASL